MCGISGYYDANNLGEYFQAFVSATRIVKHRGPDGEGLYVFNTGAREFKCLTENTDNVYVYPERLNATIALGHRRLSIIDLSDHGRQPMSNETEAVWIVFNGEIYNYIEIRELLLKSGHVFKSNTDTEVVIHAYEEWGIDCVNRFNGMWAFVLLDMSENKLFCSRDRFGVKPFYYYSDGQRFVFGSEIKQLLCFPFIKRNTNDRAIYDYLISGATDHNRETFYTDIFHLKQGHNLIFNLKNLSLVINQYYNPSFSINKDISYSEAANEFNNLLTDSIRLRLRSDVEVGSCLSGGLDSSAIVCIMNKMLREEGSREVQHSFSSHFEEKEANELVYMQEVINATGVKSFITRPTAEKLIGDLEKIVWHQDEPFGSTSIFAQWSVFHLVKEHGIKVMLDGQGADEQLAGYLPLSLIYFKELRKKRKILRLMLESYLFYLSHPDYRAKHYEISFNRCRRLFNRLINNGYTNSLNNHNLWINPEFKKNVFNNGVSAGTAKSKHYASTEMLNNDLYDLTFRSNLQALLRYEDRNSMAFSVESRTPFLDYRLVEFNFTLPSDLKIRNGYTKRVLRDAMIDILPEKVRKRKGKLGFASPEQKWQKTILRPLIDEAIESELMRDYIEPKQAHLYREGIDNKNEANFIPWRWLNLYLWLKQNGTA